MIDTYLHNGDDYAIGRPIERRNLSGPTATQDLGRHLLPETFPTTQCSTICLPSYWARFLDTSQPQRYWGSNWSVGWPVPLMIDHLTRSPPVKVDRTFRGVVCSQPYLQYKCELAAAGLLDNPNAPGALFDRRTSLRLYRSRFDHITPTGKSSLPLGLAGHRYRQGSGDVFVLRTPSTNALHFCRPPSASGSRPMKMWHFSLTFEPGHFAIHPPSDLIAVEDNA